MFLIEDEWHAEPQGGEYSTLNDALAELHRRAELPWNDAPNQAPCTNWQTCGRRYEVIEYDSSQPSWHELRRIPFLEVTASSVKWLSDLES